MCVCVCVCVWACVSDAEVNRCHVSCDADVVCSSEIRQGSFCHCVLSLSSVQFMVECLNLALDVGLTLRSNLR